MMEELEQEVSFSDCSKMTQTLKLQVICKKPLKAGGHQSNMKHTLYSGSTTVINPEIQKNYITECAVGIDFLCVHVCVLTDNIQLILLTLWAPFLFSIRQPQASACVPSLSKRFHSCGFLPPPESWGCPQNTVCYACLNIV